MKPERKEKMSHVKNIIEGHLYGVTREFREGKFGKEDKASWHMKLEKSYEEIAEIAGITPNHAGVKIGRIKAKLRLYLNQENL